MEAVLLVHLSSLKAVLNRHQGNIPIQLVTWSREELPNSRWDIRQVLEMNGRGKATEK
jgi:hypothetical protein